MVLITGGTAFIVLSTRTGGIWEVRVVMHSFDLYMRRRAEHLIKVLDARDSILLKQKGNGPQYWATVLYCPAIDGFDCSWIPTQRSLDLRITMQLTKVFWEQRFTGNVLLHSPAGLTPSSTSPSTLPASTKASSIADTVGISALRGDPVVCTGKNDRGDA
jgi:hypothetical protein